MDIGERRAWGPLVREARKAAHLDQETLAQMAQTTRRTVGAIERGETVAQTQVLERILISLGLKGGIHLDADVEVFLALLGPLLQRLDTQERERVMPAISTLIAQELRLERPMAGRMPMSGTSRHGQIDRTEVEGAVEEALAELDMAAKPGDSLGQELRDRQDRDAAGGGS